MYKVNGPDYSSQSVNLTGALNLVDFLILILPRRLVIYPSRDSRKTLCKLAIKTRTGITEAEENRIGMRHPIERERERENLHSIFLPRLRI